MNVWVAFALAWSVALTVKVKVPASEGKPLTIPVAGSNVSPLGSDPEETAQARGAVPSCDASW